MVERLRQALSPEPARRRIRQYGVLVGLTLLVVVFAVWTVWGWGAAQHKSKESTQAARNLCRQVNRLGQACVTQAPDEVRGDAIVPVAPVGSASLDPVPATTPRTGTAIPTDEAGVPQAFAPGPDALIVSVTVEASRLILTYSDGARTDAGPVDEKTLAIVLRSLSSPSPSASPSPSPSPSPPSPQGDVPTPSADSESPSVGEEGPP